MYIFKRRRMTFTFNAYFSARPNNNQPTTIKGAGTFVNINMEKVISTTTMFVQSNGTEPNKINADAHMIPITTECMPSNARNITVYCFKF